MIRVKKAETSSTVTIVTIATEIGEFEGRAYFNDEEDKFRPSTITGGKIAENRAKIKYVKEKIKRKEYELKGVKRLLASMPPSKQGYVYAIHLRDAIQREIEDYIFEWQEYDFNIKMAIEGRSMYVRSRSIDKKERNKFFQQLGESLQQLDRLTKDKKDE